MTVWIWKISRDDQWQWLCVLVISYREAQSQIQSGISSVRWWDLRHDYSDIRQFNKKPKGKTHPAAIALGLGRKITQQGRPDRQRDAPPPSLRHYWHYVSADMEQNGIMMRLLIARRYAANVWNRGQRWGLSQSGSSSYSRKQVQYIDVISLVLRQNITSFLDLTDETCWLVIHFGNRAQLSQATTAPPALWATSVIISRIL